MILKEMHKKLTLLGYMVVVLFVMLSVASYAWMTLSSTLSVTDLAVTVITDNALQLAPNEDGNPGEWSTILDLSEDSVLTAPLIPVTFVASEAAFYVPSIGLDGRIDSVSTRFSEQDGSLLSLTNRTGEAEESSYLYVADFWIRSYSSDCTVKLTSAMEREDGQMGAGTFLVGKPIWDENSGGHVDVKGAEHCVRVAFRLDEVDDQGVAHDDPRWYIWEPTYDGVETVNINGDPLNGQYKLIRQNPSTWRDNTPALRDEISYTAGEFVDENTDLWPLIAGHARHVMLFIWIEGQDIDCTNSLFANKTDVFANVQFSADTKDHGNIRPE